jgi:hypothetical protein
MCHLIGDDRNDGKLGSSLFLLGRREKSLYICARIAVSHGELPPFIVHNSEADRARLLRPGLIIEHLKHLKSKLQVVYGATSLDTYATSGVVSRIKRCRALASISHPFQFRYDIAIFVISLC